MAYTVIFLFFFLPLTQHVFPMCAPDGEGGVCKDIVGTERCLDPNINKEKAHQNNNWPCQLPTSKSKRDTGRYADDKIELLANMLRREVGEVDGRESGGNLLDVAMDVKGQPQPLKGCASNTAYKDSDVQQGEPYVLFGQANQNAEYLLFMVDPDAPGCKDSEEICYYLHWVVSDIPGSSLLQPSHLEEGKTLLEYAPPTPPFGTHRYQLLLFKLNNGQGVSDIPDAKHRANFDLNYFLGVHRLCDELTAGFQFRVKSSKE